MTAFPNYLLASLAGLILLFTDVAQGQEMRSAAVERISSSGRSFILNRGEFYGLKVGMRAEFMWQDPDRVELLRLGRAEVVKVDPDRSYWLFESVRQDVVLETPAEIEFALTSDLEQGIRPYRIHHNKVILNPGVHPLEYFSNRKSASPKELTVLSEDFEEAEKVVETDVLKDEDISVDEYDYWYESRSKQYIPEYRQELSSKRPRSGSGRHDISVVAEDSYDRAYDSIVEAYLRHNKKVREDREAFFYDMRPDENYAQVRKTLTIDNVFQSYQRKRRAQTEVSDRAVRRMERDGPLWSSDMSQQELRDFFIESGVEQEKRRQERALREHDSNEVTFEFATGLQQTFNPDDPDFQGQNYSLGISYEFHVGRTVQSLNKWGITFGVESSVAFYDIGGFNAIYSEGHFSIGANYYFYNNPAVLRDYIGYVGFAVKRGNGELRSVQLENEYDIQSLRYPLYVGLKYRFSAGDERERRTGIGWGVNFRLSFETGEKNLLGFSDEVFERTINPGVVNFHLGLSTYF